MVASLNDFKEESRSVLNGLREYLQQVALLIVVNQDLVLLKQVDVLGDFD